MKKILLTYSTIALILGSFPLMVFSQDARLHGKVVPAESPNNPPLFWRGIRITVMNKKTKLEVKGQQDFTKDHTWYHNAPIGAMVEVLFDRDPCYVKGSMQVEVDQASMELETVRLQKSRECLLGERRQRRRNMNKRAHHYEANAVQDPSSDADLIPTVAILKKELAEQAELTRRGVSFDSFQYNFAIKEEIYGDIPALAEVLKQFRSDSKNKDLFAEVGDAGLKEYRESARAQFEISDQINTGAIKSILKDEDLSPNVRGSAGVALLNLKLDHETREELLKYHRKQLENPSSLILPTSMVSLARIGDDNDKKKIIDLVLNGEKYQRLIAMEAVAAAQLIDGPGAVPEGVQALSTVAQTDEDPELRKAAVFALRPYAYQDEQVAIKTLMTSAKDPVKEVRVEAVAALSVGEVEDQPRVRKLLWSVVRSDPVQFVRQTAILSLRGPSRLGRTLRTGL